MKLRIINNGGLFFPQYAKKGYYGTHWVGFGNPPIKFAEEKNAIAFVALIGKAVAPDSKVTTLNVVWRNFDEKPKKVSGGLVF